MNAFLLLIPFLIIRFGLLSFMNNEALRRAAYFAPVQGGEKTAYFIYQLSNIGMFLYLLFLTVKVDFSWEFYLGSICYLGGLLLCAIAIVNFSSPNSRGLSTTGVYKFSRNPMYIAYFVCFMGMALLTHSLVLSVFVLIFQISAHWIILSEERWCLEKFGESYRQYMKNVRRYI